MQNLTSSFSIKESKQRNFLIDVIKALAIVMVILLHVASNNFYQFTSITQKTWLISTFYDSLTRICVPLFLICSGYYALSPEKKFKIRSKFVRLLYPLLFWGSIYLLFRSYFLNETFTFKSALFEVISGPMYPHIWYLYGLMGLYLVTPLLRVLILNSSEFELKYFMFLWVVFTSIYPILHLLRVPLGISPFITTGSYLGYFFLGGILNKNNSSPFFNLNPTKYLVLFVISTLATFILTISICWSTNSANEFFFNYGGDVSFLVESRDLLS